jgi:hypothetical protein
MYLGGENVYMRNCTWSKGGHDLIAFYANYVRVEDSTLDNGGWDQALIDDGLSASEANKFPGARCCIFTSGMFTGSARRPVPQPPLGFVSVTRSTLKQSGTGQSQSDTPGATISSGVFKIQGAYLQFYDNIVYDGSKNHCFTRSRDSSNDCDSGHTRMFHNVFYNFDNFGDGADKGIAGFDGTVGGGPSFDDQVYKNNIFRLNNLTEDWTVKYSFSSTASTFSFSNQWLDGLFDGNEWDVLSGSLNLYFGGSSVATGVADAESTYPNNWSNNSDSPTINFVNASARTRAGFALDTGSSGLGAAEALTTVDGTGSGTSVTLDDPLYFFAAKAYDMDPADQHWGNNAPESDWIKIGSGSPVQIDDINYTTGVVTLTASRSWTDGDEVFMVKQDGSTVFDDIGIKA